jgi:hypothetical protein
MVSIERWFGSRALNKEQIDSQLARINAEFADVSNRREQTRRISISSEALESLFKIVSIFKKHKTDYRIIIAPTYRGARQHPLDVLTLNVLFGPGNVFDFSVPGPFTEVRSVYPVDDSHFSIAVGCAILDSIYADREPDSLAPADSLQ